MPESLIALQRQVRVLQGGVLTLIATIAAGALSAETQSPPSSQPAQPRIERFDEITVGRINIAGPDGVNRIVLAHQMPQAPFGGELLERTIPPGMAGIIYCAANGDEVGGIGVSGDARSGHALITLDYRNTPLEAIGLGTSFSPDGQGAALVVMDSPTGTVDAKKINAGDQAEIKRLQAMMVSRIELGVNHHNAALVFNDRDRRPRITIGVDADGNPEVKLLNEEGAEIARLPSR